MKPRFHSPLLAVAATLLALPAASAATWTGATDASWVTSTNWTGTAPDNTTPQAIVYDGSSTANLTQTLDGSYTLTGITLANTFTTATATINTGTGTNTLTIGASGIDMSAAAQNLTIGAGIAVEVAQTWNVAATRTLTLGGGIADNGAVNIAFNGGGTYAFTNTTGAFNEGGTVTFGSGATWRLETSNSQANSLWFGSAGTAGTGSTITLSGNNTIRSHTATSRFVNNNIVAQGDITLGHAGGGGINFFGSIDLGAGTRQITTATNAGVASTINGTISNGAITKAGAGTLTLAGASDYIGATAINEGRLNLTGSLTSAVTVASGAQITGPGSTTGLLTLSSGGGLVLAGGATTTSVTANGATFSGSNVVTFTTTPTTSTVYDVFTYGSGTVTTPANLTVAAHGPLTNDIPNQKYIFTATGPATRTWNTTTGTWDNTGANLNWAEGDKKFFNSDTAVFGNIASDSVITLTGAISPDGVTVSNAANKYTFQTGTITGTTGLTKSNNGTLCLTSANTYSGGTILNAGILQVGINAALGSGSLALNGGTLSSDSVTARTLSNILTIGGDMAFGDLTNNGTLTLSGTVDLQGSTRVLTTSSGVTLSGVISNGGITKADAGALAMSGVNTFSGGTTLSAGILRVGNNSAFGSGSLTLNGGTLSSDSGTLRTLANNLTIGGNVALGDGTNAGELVFGGTVDLQGATRTLTSVLGTQGARFNGVISNGGITKEGTGRMTLVNDSLVTPNTFTGATSINAGILATSTGALASSASVTIANVGSGGGLALGGNGTTIVNNLSGVTGSVIRSDFNISGNGARILQVNQTANGAYAGTFTQGASRTISLIKEGAATLTLSGNATGYTGTTTVTNGTLAVTGSLGNTAVTVASGATLGGNGNLGGSLTIQAGGAHALAVAATSGAQVTRVITGALDLTAVGDILSLTAASPPATGTYILATATGGITGSPESVIKPGIPGTVAVVGNNLELTVTASNDFSSWAAANAPGQTINQDHDNDGVSNGIEFFMGQSGSGFTALPSVTTAAGVRSVTWTKSINYTGTYGTHFAVETSTTLVGTWNTETLGGTVVISGPNNEFVTYTFPAGPVKNFARLKVTGP